jgi:hypothetical protein
MRFHQRILPHLPDAFAARCVFTTITQLIGHVPRRDHLFRLRLVVFYRLQDTFEFFIRSHLLLVGIPCMLDLYLHLCYTGATLYQLLCVYEHQVMYQPGPVPNVYLFSSTSLWRTELSGKCIERIRR